MASTGMTRQRLLIEISVALFLSAVYFWMVMDYAIGDSGNATNAQVFTSCSTSYFQLHELFDVWKGRLSGLFLTGWIFDLLVNHTAGAYGQFCVVFGLYQGLWLFLLMLTVVLALRHAFVINLGIFAGVMYNFLPVGGLYFYPWDIPATLFFTLAVLFHQQRKPGWMVAAVCAGCFFKETVLVCALLALFVTGWQWWRRILFFALMAAVYLAGKKLLLASLHENTAALSMNDSQNLGDVIKTHLLRQNFQTLFSLAGLYVVFANAGTMAAVLLFGWQRRFLPYLVLILAFLAGQAMYGAFLEFRIFMQILPLSLIILIERFWPAPGENPAQVPRKKTRPPPPAKKTGKLSDQSLPGWALRDSIRVLPLITAGLIGITTAVAGWQYSMILEKKPVALNDNNPVSDENKIQNLRLVSAWFHHTRIGLDDELRNPAENERALKRLSLARDWSADGEGNKESKLAISSQSLRRDNEAYRHFRAAVDLSVNATTNFVVANNFAWLLATSSDPGLRNGKEAVTLAELACQSTQYKNPAIVGTLAIAYAEAGRFDDAIAADRRAETIALEQGNGDVAENCKRLLELFQSGRAYHQ